MKIPTIVNARDGSAAVLLAEIGEAFRPPRKLSFSLPAQVQLEPRGSFCWIRIDLSSEWETQCTPEWFEETGYFRNLSLPESLPEFAAIAIGHLLETSPPRVPSEEGKYAASILLSEALQAIESRLPADDREINLHWAAKLYYSTKYRVETPLRAHDLLRLRTSFSDFLEVVNRYSPEYWRPASQTTYECTNAMLRDFERGALPFHRPIIPTLQALHVLNRKEHQSAREHLIASHDALERDPANLVEATREAILALEALAKVRAEEPKATLGGAVKILVEQNRIRRPLDKILHAVNGFRGDAPGVMHAGAGYEDLQASELQWVRNMAAASIIYLASLEEKTN